MTTLAQISPAKVIPASAEDRYPPTSSPTSSTFSIESIPFNLAELLVQAGAEKEPTGFNTDEFLAAYRAASGQLGQLKPIHRAAALAFMADGASVCSDAFLVGEGAPALSQVSTSPFSSVKSLRSFGKTRQQRVSVLSSTAWRELEASKEMESVEGLALLYYLAERFQHPEGPEVKMERVSQGVRKTTFYLHDDDSTIPMQSDAYTIGTALITIAGDEACAHGTRPDIPLDDFKNFVATTSVGPLPLTALTDFSPAFGSDVTGFVKLFNSLVVPLQNQALDVERLHSGDITELNPLAIKFLWIKVDEAATYIEGAKEKILRDRRIEKDEKDFLKNQWTRALLKNLLIQQATFSAFAFTIHRNLTQSSSPQPKQLLAESEERVLRLLATLARGIDTLKHLTTSLDDIYLGLRSYFMALDRLGPTFRHTVLRLPTAEREK
ncbi:hypothetical protein T439DRAFT_320905 [Meredithblackwellia eburnea MCA 4105]